MTGAAEMRRVMAHAVAHLEKATEIECGRKDDHTGTRLAKRTTLVAFGYARGVLDLLGAYLVDPEPAAEQAPDLTLHLLDSDGALWTSIADARWVYLDGSPMQDSHARADIAERWGPVREVWLR